MVLSPKSIVFVHPDLGIGGAERLMVDMAVGLESQHHQVTIYTSHHSKTHCFPETLDLNVHVHGDTWLPRHVGGYFHIVFAILKQIYLCCVLVYQVKSGLQKVDVVFVDQLSIGIPILKWTSAKVVYYCHFPDQLLAKRSSRLRLFYRYLFDTLEAYTTNQADLLLVNSKYTLTVVNEVFPNLTTPIHVVYPGICDPFPPTSTATFPSLSWLTQVTFPIFVSINRYEKKKDLSLALQAFALFPTSKSVPSLLIFIGGYDSRVQENVATLTTLTKLCASLNLPYSMTLPTSNPFTSSPSTASTSSSIPTSTKHVLFLRNLDEPMKHAFISMATAVLYTPSHEHFGIVPIESMALGTPVIAMANGGPLETVVHLQTGYLCPSMSMSSVVNEWVQGMQWGVDVQRSNERRTVVQHHCQMRVKDLFTRDRMVEQLGQLLQPLLCQVASPTSFQSVEQEEEKKDKEK